MYAVGQTDTLQLVHARAYTRANSAFVTFFKSEENAKKLCNAFYLSTSGQDISQQVQVGAKLWPDHRCDNLSQHFHRLLHCIGLANSMASPNISLGSFSSDSFVLATDFESVPGQAHGSGASTHNSQMTFDIRGLSDAPADLPVTAYVTIMHEAIITIEQDGVTLAI
jgi:hypothetical protein